MSRDPKLYLQEIKDCASKILDYCHGLDQRSFEDHGMAYDAVLRNLEIIGEASKNPAARGKSPTCALEKPTRLIP